MITIKEDFLDFLRMGSLRNFAFGSTKQNVEELLGVPLEQFGDKESSMIRYDRTEFYFYNDSQGIPRLVGIMVLPFSVADNGNLKMDYHWLTSKVSYNQVKDNLIMDRIDFIETTSPANKEDKVIRTSGNVDILFFEDDQLICKLGHFIPIHELEQYIV